MAWVPRETKCDINTDNVIYLLFTVSYVLRKVPHHIQYIVLVL